MQFQFPKPWLLVTFSESKSVPPQCLQTTKSLISSCRRIGETILSSDNPQITAAIHYSQKQTPERLCKQGVLKKIAKLTGNHLCWSPALVKSQALMLVSLRFCKTFKDTLLQLRWLLLIILNYIILYQTRTAHLLTRIIILFIYLFITLFNVGTLKQFIADKNQPLNIITKKTKAIIIIIKMNAYGYTVIFMFGILNNNNQYF